MSADQLKQVIAETLSPYAETRRTAEANLKAAQRIPGHPLEILKLVASSDGGIDPAVRQAAAVHFKNLVKKGWDPNPDDDDHDHDPADAIVLTPNDRVTIKSHLVQLMCTTPPQIQVQLSEAISLIAASDFPDHWANLLPELVQQFSTPNPETLVGVLKTANSIFKSFRHVGRSNELYRSILVTLHAVQAPLLALFTNLGQAVDATVASAPDVDKKVLAVQLEALRLVCRIFYSLNFQDLPEFFEDHMDEWMAGFAAHLQRQLPPSAIDPNEEIEPSPLDKVQAAIITNLMLYAEKDEEPFLVYLPNFTTLVWNLLVAVTPYPKHDALATTSIRFLSSLVEKLMHRQLFEDPAVLQQIVGRIVVPNLMFRDSDLERFEDDPREFLVTEVEGSDSETRRRCSQNLLRAMCRQFESETTSICLGHVATMLQQFASNPNANWKAKDAAIHLMMGIAIRKESRQGVSEVNDAVNLLEFFQANILPELQNLDHASRPVVKATAIKFVCTFRNQFSRDNMVQLLPLLISHLGSSVVVVHTFAAYAIERILVCKEEDGAAAGVKRPKISSQELMPLLEPLFNGLFLIIDNADHNENDYAMKCVMRSLVTAKDGVIPVTPVVMAKLTAALGRIAKNPRNPQYNHFLFESIAVLIRSVCSKDPNQTAAFEPLLFEPFNVILQMDIAEFTPYVFQVLAQLLEYRPANQGLGQAYTSLFAPILTPMLWEQKGNVPALTRLLQAYVRKAPTELLPHLDRILGVFQKLISAKSTECSAFDLLSVVTTHVPHDAMESKIPTIFQILLVRLQGSTKAPRYKKLVTTYFALFVGKYGPQAFVERLDGVQPGLAVMVLEQVWIPRLKTEPPIHQRSETKVHVVGLTKLLFESPLLLSDPRGHQVWSDALAGAIALLTSPVWRAGTTAAAAASQGYEDDDELEIGYDAQFSKLSFASRAPEDYFAEVPDAGLAFCQSLHQALASSPTPLLPLVQAAVHADEKLSGGLETMMRQAGLGVVGI